MINAAFLSVVLVVCLIGWLVWFYEKRRREALAELAAVNGLSFTEEGPDSGFLENTGLELFRQGRSRDAINMIRMPSSSGEISFFDYSYTTGGGKSRTVHSFTLALMARGRLAVPRFDLKPENFLHKLGEAIGYKDIDIQGYQVFSDNYRLTGPDEASVLAFFTPRRVAALERRPGLRIQGAPGWLVLFNRNGTLPVDEWGPFMQEVKSLSGEAL